MINRHAIFGSFAVAATMCLTSCTLFQKSNNNNSIPVVQEPAYQIAEGGLKIAYVDIDSLLLHYNFFTDLSEEMLRKEENSRLMLNEEAQKFQTEYEDFQRKLKNNVFSSQARAESEQKRLLKMQEDLNALNNKLTQELNAEQEKNNTVLSETIQEYIKKYNKSHGYNLILTKSGDNILYADKALDITGQILAGLNAEYSSKDQN